jgi:hypothetical protein
MQVAAGTMPGISVHRIHGTNPAVASTTTPVWPGVGQYPYVDRSRTILVYSDDADDTYRGTGARLVRIVGLDAKHEVQMEDIALRGTTPVPTLGDYTHLYGASVMKAGSRAGTAGLITFECSLTNADVGYIAAPDNRMNNAVFTVPAHTNAYLFDFHFNLADANQSVNIGIRHTSPVEENRVWIEVFDDIITPDGHVEEILTVPYFIPPFTDIELVASKSGGVANEVQANATLVLIDTAFEWDNIYTQDETYTISQPDED